MKKQYSVISMLLIVSLLLGSLCSIGVSAADSLYVQKDVKAYLFTEDNTTMINCLFRRDLPEIPYIDTAEYLNVIFIDPYTEAHNEDGTYTVTNVFGYTMEIDAEKDEIYIENFDMFGGCEIDDEGSSITLDFIDAADAYFTAEPSVFCLDLGEYNIDIAEADGRVYLPLAVISGMFSYKTIAATYFDGEIYFVHSMDDTNYFYNVDLSPYYQTLTRSQKMAEFNYNVIALIMDRFYGNPSKSIVSEALESSGFDKMLDTFDENTPVAKRLLLSTDMCDYFDGLLILSYYFDDGGHTFFYYPPVCGLNLYPDEPLVSKWAARLKAHQTDETKLAYDLFMKQNDYYATDYKICDIRDEEYKKYADEIVKVWDEGGSRLLIHGDDLAVFVFDGFELSTPYEFKEALDIAKEYGVKNFLIDESCNGGGYVATYEFICALITNDKYHTNTYSTSIMFTTAKSVITSYDVLDFNLNGVYDDDADVRYDFNFAILTSCISFSSGNELSVNAKDRGILIIGEQSGGGTCYVTHRFFADGLYCSISETGKSCRADGSDVDSGAPVDYKLVTENGDGTKDYTGFYDLDHINELMSGFYSTVTFLDYDGTALWETRYRDDDTVTVIPEPVRETDDEHCYVFSGWDKEITAVSGDAVYTAVYEEFPKFTPGDVNGDGFADNKDVVLLFRFMSNNNQTVNIIAVDVNGDGFVDNKDVVILFRFLSVGGVELSSKPYIVK